MRYLEKEFWNLDKKDGVSGLLDEERERDAYGGGSLVMGNGCELLFLNRLGIIFLPNLQPIAGVWIVLGL